MKQLKSIKKGFTLIEALIVAVIVGLLASIAIIKIGTARETSADSVGNAIAADINKAIQRAVIDGLTGPIPAAVNSNAGVEALVDALAAQPRNYFTDASVTKMKDFIGGAGNGQFSLVSSSMVGDTALNDIEVSWDAQ